MISPEERDTILDTQAWGRWPPRTAALGGGIGIQGWRGGWNKHGTRALTWACVSLQNGVLEVLYDEVPVGTPVLILP